MNLRQRIVAEARQWIDTPEHHQGRAKQVGVDCVGLPIGVCRELDLVPREKDVEPYSRQPDGVSLMRLSDTLMRRIDAALIQPGDVVVIRWRRDPQHFGIVGDYPGGGLSIIHTMRKVVEQRLDDAMRKRIVAAYLLPGVEA